MEQADAGALGQDICAGFARDSAGPAAEAVTVSIGATAYRGGAALTELLSKAEAALYEAKRDGRNRLCWHDAAQSGSPMLRDARSAA